MYFVFHSRCKWLEINVHEHVGRDTDTHMSIYNTWIFYFNWYIIVHQTDVTDIIQTKSSFIVKYVIVHRYFATRMTVMKPLPMATCSLSG